MKIIGLDIGEKRIGVATVDTSVKVAVPLKTVIVDGTEIEQIQQIMKDEDTKHLVIGLPRDYKGEETAQSKIVRTFADKLKAAGAKIKFQDESLTSVQAESYLKKHKKRFSKEDVDMEAASIILQDFIESFGSKPEEEKEQPTDTKQPKEPKKSKRTKGKHRALKVIIFIFVTLIVGSIFAISWYVSQLDPVIRNCDTIEYETPGSSPNKNDCTPKQFIIEAGESVNSIADRLGNLGIIRSSLAFRIYVRLENKSSQLKPGSYMLSPSKSVESIVGMFVAGSKPEVFRLKLIPGETLREIRKRIIDLGYSEESVDEALNASYDYDVLADRPDGATLEGYIYGETHEFYAHATPRDIISRFIREFDRIAKEEGLVEKFAAQGLTLHEGITLASIVQREAEAKDMPGVAGVFFNRLSRDMPLEADATTIYAADLIKPDRDREMNCRDIDPSLRNCLELYSPYNTRNRQSAPGLTPGPISNPGLAALRAVANPTDHSYIFFLTGDDGNKYYANTNAAHERNIREHCRERCRIPL
jgi:UPF0755 protein